MSNINRVVLSGNLTRDPEVKGNGSVCSMSVAVNGRRKDGNEWVDDVNFFDLVAFGAQGENCAKYLQKGSPVIVDGRLDWQSWEKDGQKRSKVQVIAQQVQFLKATDVSQPAPTTDDIPF